MRRKTKKWVSIGDALGNAAKRAGIAKKMRQFEVWNRWDKIAGPLIAAHAKPSRWQGDSLVLAVEHSSWMQELSYLKSELLEKIQNQIPYIAIKDLRFEIGKIAKAPDEFVATSPPCVLDDDEREFIEQAAKEIKDEDTRLTVSKLITKDFQQKKTSRKHLK